MQIHIKYFAQIKSKAGKSAEVLELEIGATLQKCIEKLSKENDHGITDILFDESGVYQDTVILVINSQQTRYAENPKMNDGDELMMRGGVVIKWQCK